MAAIGRTNDAYRKPSLLMFEYVEKNLNGGQKFTKSESMYCGDAAGRKECEGLKRDFSADDILFARALGAKFFTPELLFLGKDDRLGVQLEKTTQILTATDQ
jgi:bifunctional polynucleotide phosphatase/kinase